MKKFLSLTVAGLMYVGFANAQAVAVTTTLVDVISLAVAFPTAAITMTTTDHYNNGNSTTQVAGITVISNQAWDLSVVATNANTTDPISTNTIPVGDFSVEIVDDAGTGTNNGRTNLTTGTQVLINSADPTAARIFDITYYANGGANFFGKVAGAYANTYTYSVTAD